MNWRLLSSLCALLIGCFSGAFATDLRIKGEDYTGAEISFSEDKPLIHVNFAGCGHVEVLATIAGRAGWEIYLRKDARAQLQKLQPFRGAVVGKRWDDVMASYLSLLSGLSQNDRVVFAGEFVGTRKNRKFLLRLRAP
jgi:hypothetical protein